jgi:hypothetical protein
MSHQFQNINNFETIEQLNMIHQIHTGIEYRRSNKDCWGYKNNEDKITDGPSMDREPGSLGKHMLKT